VVQESSALRVRMSNDLFSQPIEPLSDMRLSAIKRILPFLASYDLSAHGLVVEDLRYVLHSSPPLSCNATMACGVDDRFNLWTESRFVQAVSTC
jgi:hypothetical protein